MRLKHAASIALALLAMTSRPAAAWGLVGHVLVADIAEARLTPAARLQVDALLALEQRHGLDDVAGWADVIGHAPRDQGGLPETLPWHYVDVDINAAGYVPARDCPGGACVVAKLPEFARTLADKGRPAAERLTALKWVVHLMADLHEPLNVAERDHDKGGLKIKVTFYGQDAQGHLNLHSLWGDDLLAYKTGLKVSPDYTVDPAKARAAAASLDQAITAEQAALWTTPGLMGRLEPLALEWAAEGRVMAKDLVYGKLPPSGELGQDYDQAAWPAVRQRVQQAGVRLAALLNATLAP
ncbi:S1/P1 nuclease [Nitrospirillum iridis]|uniref:S1/P1 nuclease n=1 Tax=Nitrospirillum iridis TaxID=765888 RepID=A0A7X0AU12_9PROT|nr:S1/P1 nuclease [Nitrospirillum iridis]MBB6250088.1 hypothetical protein [Nitrospirillum iridis]